MSTITSAPAAAPSIAGPSWGRWLGVALKRWWVARMARRLENLAIAQLHAMSNRQLRDIGISRSEIEIALSGERARDPTISGNC